MIRTPVSLKFASFLLFTIGLANHHAAAFPIAKDGKILPAVYVAPEVQLARLMARDGAGEADARARIASQIPLEQKIAMADWTIDNGGTEEQTRAAVDALHTQLLSRERMTP